jgi:hypothetical protein
VRVCKARWRPIWLVKIQSSSAFGWAVSASCVGVRVGSFSKACRPVRVGQFSKIGSVVVAGFLGYWPQSNVTPHRGARRTLVRPAHVRVRCGRLAADSTSCASASCVREIHICRSQRDARVVESGNTYAAATPQRLGIESRQDTPTLCVFISRPSNSAKWPFAAVGADLRRHALSPPGRFSGEG